MSLLGYAWCLGKAVPVYDNKGLVSNAEYARFYISELPTFSAADYPNITVFGDRLLRFTESQYLELMNRGAFEYIGDYPLFSMLHRTDKPTTTPYGYNWIKRNDDRAYAITTFAYGTNGSAKNAAYFDFYFTCSDHETYNTTIYAAVRYGEEDDFNLCLDPCQTVESGIILKSTNITNYLVITPTNVREPETPDPLPVTPFLPKNGAWQKQDAYKVVGDQWVKQPQDGYETQGGQWSALS
jgi:hypothetical protein